MRAAGGNALGNHDNEDMPDEPALSLAVVVAALRELRTAHGPAERTLQGELRGVIVGHTPQIFAACLQQCLGRLQHFDRQSLSLANANEVVVVRISSECQQVARRFNLLFANLHLSVGFGHFPGHKVQRGQLLNLRLA